MTARRVYLDHNATTPVRREVVDVMTAALSEGWGNPSSVHGWGEEARLGVERARRAVAKAVGAANAEEIIFTSGGTESDNLALRGLARLAREQRGATRILTSTAEHAAVLDCCADLQRREGFTVEFLPLDAFGRVTPEALETALEDDAALVALMAANNETGVVQPIAELAALAHDAGAFFFTDAVQCPGRVPVDVSSWGVDAAAFSAHKCHGPKGAGALWIRDGLAIEGTQTGGGQEKGLRGGTENTAGIAGLGTAIRLAAAEQPDASESMRTLREHLWDAVQAVWPQAVRNSPPDDCLPNTLNVSFPGFDGRRIVADMGRRGFAFSAASACSTHGTAKSHVLVAMGIGGERLAGAVRLSLGRSTTAEEIEAFGEELGTYLRDGGG